MLEVFALRDIVPRRFAGRLQGEDGELRIEVDVHGLSAAEAGKLAQRLRAMVCVERVLLRTPATRLAPARRAAAGSLS
ncbi:MAG: hypothetical protein FJX56_09795 [Alphaproteobacteria bacterium]|nr:hypothetical protein [Alphaproteobacteria bacterium]